MKIHNNRETVGPAKQPVSADRFVLVADYEASEGSAERALLLMKDEHFYRYAPGDGLSELSDEEARRLIETRLALRRHAVTGAAEQAVRTIQGRHGRGAALARSALSERLCPARRSKHCTGCGRTQRRRHTALRASSAFRLLP